VRLAVYAAMARLLATVGLLLLSASVGNAQFCHRKKGCAKPLKTPKETSAASQEAPETKRKLQAGGYTPGISPLSFENAGVVTTNLGGWCGWYCQHVKNGPDGTPPGYDTDVGTCADPATPYTPSGQYVYDNTLYEDPPECTPSDPVKMLLSGIGTTTSGTEIDLEIVNTSAYVPWNANQNGLNGVWAEINVLGNEPTGFKFCFTDHATGEEVSLDNYTFTFVDLDNTITGYEEELQFLESDIDGYELYVANDGSASEVQITSVELAGSTYLRFRSSVYGIGKDNPYSLTALTDESPAQGAAIQAVQQRRSFKLFFSQKSCFQVRIAVVWPGYHNKVDFVAANADGSIPTSEVIAANTNINGIFPAGTGRNIQFAVEGDLVVSPSPPPPPSPPPAPPNCGTSPLPESLYPACCDGSVSPYPSDCCANYSPLPSEAYGTCCDGSDSDPDSCPSTCSPSNIDCRSTADCPASECCIPYRNRRLVHGSAMSIKERLRKRLRKRQLLFSVAPIIGSCGCCD
jgi:hypothetical protein